MAETEPKGGLSPDDFFMLAWITNRFEALDAESLASGLELMPSSATSSVITPPPSSPCGAWGRADGPSTRVRAE
jgi:hypothetical protein